MVKLIKIIGRTIGISFEWILIFIIFFSFAIHTSQIQTFVIKKITNYLSTELKTEISIEHVNIAFINRFALDGILIKDQQNDTLAYVSTLFITLDEFNNKHKLILNEAEIENSVFKLKREKKTGEFNYKFLQDYFSSSKKTKSKPFIVELNELHLTHVDLNYDDYRQPYKKFGMDYNHLDFRDINLNINDISIKNGVIKGHVHHFATNESCGFILNNFSGTATVSPKGIDVRNLKIKTPLSTIFATKVHLIMNDYQDFLTFEDSVSFDSHLNYSKVSMLDVSYFSPPLEGMDQIVYLKANVYDKVPNLKIRNLTFKTGHKTVLYGNLTLPNFRKFHEAFFNEKIDYAYIDLTDLEKIKLPKSASTNYLNFEEHLSRLNYFETNKLRLVGSHSDFVVDSKKIKTDLGNVEIKNGIQVQENQDHIYSFKTSDSSTYDIKIDNFKLGKFLQNKDLGLVNGDFSLSGTANSFSTINFNSIEGDIKQFDYSGYSYKNIIVKEGSFQNKKIEAKIDIKDDNLNLTYDGSIDFTGKTHMDFKIDLTQAILDNLNLSKIDNTKLKSEFKIDIYGNESNNLKGDITLSGLVYSEGGKSINIPELMIHIDRTLDKDHLVINSEMGNINVDGKVDFKTIIYDLENQVSQLFPALIPPKKNLKKYYKTNNIFEYKIEINEVNNFLSLFLPDLKIDKGTKIKGVFNGISQDASMTISSPGLKFKEMKFNDLKLAQNMSSTNLNATIDISKFSLNDSLSVDNLKFKVDGTKEILNSEISWNPSTIDESKIKWATSVLGIDKYNITLLPSFFSLKHKKWNVVNNSNIKINGSTIDIENFLLEREKQYLSANGRISKSNEDQLNFRMSDFKLDDFSSVFGSPVDIKGVVNGWGFISNPYTNLKYMGDANIQDLYVNDHEIGNIFIQTQWDQESNSYGMAGDLMYKNHETFSFDGHYYAEREDEKLDLALIFDNTDIQFVNSFLDPDVVKDVKGLLVGKVKVEGTIEKPELIGEIQLNGGNAKLEILGVNFGLNGKIIVDKDGFYINNMPVNDEDGNTGSLVGSIYHDNFENFNFDLNFNLEDNAKRFGIGYLSSPYLDKFLVMNTPDIEGNVYFGKGYATGMVNIFGYADNIEINVDLKTKKGTKINFPMYGSTDIKEEELFIIFKKEIEDKAKDPKIDFTGVALNLNFKVTPDADLKVILNKETGDEISTNGSGDITVSLDNHDNLTLDGTFKINEGHYDFVMRPINQRFEFEKGGTLTWTGDPYNANLDFKCYYLVNANLNEISPNQNLGTSSSKKQEVKCLIELTESLLKPNITFNILTNTKGPEKALLDRITSDPDLLNKQFFSLLLFNKFQRIDGQSNSGAGESAALDLVSSQINTMLSQVSKNYLLNVDLAKNNLTGKESVALGVTKVINDRLVLSGSFGVGSAGTVNQNQNNLIGDVNLEYTLNESGTFKINIFNESNQNSVLQSKLGLFTQGAGVQYQEEFNSFKDFVLFQTFLDIFRKNKKIKIKKRNKQEEVPLNDDVPKTSFILQDWNLYTIHKSLYYSSAV